MKIITYFLLAVILFSNQLYSQDYWSRLNGPFGGEVISIQKHPNGNLLALRNENLYVSTDNADTWNPLPQSMVNSNLCMDISPGGTVYVGKSSGGIWWTSNLGQSWNFNPVHIAPHSGTWTSVITTKVNASGHVYINSFASFNGGSNFSGIQIGNPARLPSGYVFGNSNFVYAATTNGVFYSDNNGSSWNEISSNLPSLNVSSIVFENGSVIVGLVSNGIYKTTDNGLSWLAINNGITDLNISKICIDQQNNYYAGTSTGKIFKSINSGNSWTEIFTSESSNKINSICIDAGKLYAATKNYGIIKSTDNGATWIEKNSNLYMPGTNSLAFSDNGEIFSASAANGVMFSPDNGAHWEKRINGLPSSFITSVFRSANQILFAGVYHQGIFASSNNGLSWNFSGSGILPDNVIRYFSQSPNGFLFAISSAGQFADTMKIYRSSDNGSTWSKIYQPPSGGINMFTMDVSGNLFIAGFNNMFEQTILYSTDNGNSWKENILHQFFTLNQLTSSGNNLYISSNTNLYSSSDMGSTWNQINNGNWAPANFGALAVNNLGHIFISVGNQFYVTTNNGTSWNLQTSGLMTNSIINKLIFNSSGYLFGLTYYDGIFKTQLSTLTSAGVNTSGIPDKFSLKQNYPNPFNPDTRLEIEIPGETFVSLKIYDISGKEIKVLINERKVPGKYSVHFDGSNLPSGVYFCRMETEGFIDVKSMVLIK